MSRFVQDAFSCDTWIAPAFINSALNCKSVWQLNADFLAEHEILPEQSLYLWRDSERSILYTSSNPAEIHKIDSLGNETIIPVPDSRVTTSIHFLDEDKMVAFTYSESIDQGQSIRILENNEWRELNLDSLNITDLSLGRIMYVDRSGFLWVNEEKGLIKYDGKLLFYYPFDNEITLNYNGSMIEDSYGSFWISTSDNGLIRWSPDSKTIYNTSNSAILSNACRELQIVDDHLWINHYYGLTKFKIEPIENTSQTLYLQSIQYKIYPNPSPGHFTITNPLNEFRRIDIFTIDGIPVSSYSGKDLEWNLTIDVGVYIVKLKQKLSEIFEKIIIVD